ncbi:hypothetical protein GCM10007880_65570 [Mesorhizobium amorphae]|nr:hypothetical protein GCM10007880_65570 [Mesorhizobium amorphae]
MRGQFARQLRSNRNQASLVEFGAVDGDDLFDEIDILKGQAQGLANPHAGPVEE